MLTLTFSRLLTPSQNRLINVAAFGTPAIENLQSTSFTPRRITPPSVFANELYDSHRASGNPPDASLHSVWTTSPCFTSRSICLAVNFTELSIPHSPSGFKREIRFWKLRGAAREDARPPHRPRQARSLPLRLAQRARPTRCYSRGHRRQRFVECESTSQPVVVISTRSSMRTPRRPSR